MTEKKTDGCDSVHSGFSFSVRNTEGGPFQKWVLLQIWQFVIPASRRETVELSLTVQVTLVIDYILARNKDRKLVKDVKVISSEEVVSQNRIVASDVKIKLFFSIKTFITIYKLRKHKNKQKS